MNPLLDIADLVVEFPSAGGRATMRAVDQVSLAIAPGSVHGLVGESGSGKSTLGLAIAGLLEPVEGELRFDGYALPSRRGRKALHHQATAIQMVFQDPGGSLNPRHTIGEILHEPLRLHPGRIAGDPAACGVRWLQRVGLRAEHALRYPHELSGGQRQRVAIARALILEPRFVICDEPISALDVSVQAQIVNLLGELKAEFGLTVLFIAHDLAMVRHVSDTITVMYLGRVVEEGPADVLCSDPLHPYAQRLLAAMPVPDPRRERTRLRVPDAGTAAAAPSMTQGCHFAPRCPLVEARCLAVRPALHEFDNGRRVACHHAVPPGAGRPANHASRIQLNASAANTASRIGGDSFTS